MLLDSTTYLVVQDHTYDKFVVKAYEIMEVLFNYKRTVEDFKVCGLCSVTNRHCCIWWGIDGHCGGVWVQKCGTKGSNPYNFPYVSDCVGGATSTPVTCKDSANPVPCPDGVCRSDYISCLRAISEKDRQRDGYEMLRWAFKEYADSLAAASAGGAGAQPGGLALAAGTGGVDNDGAADIDPDELAAELMKTTNEAPKLPGSGSPAPSADPSPRPQRLPIRMPRKIGG